MNRPFFVIFGKCLNKDIVNSIHINTKKVESLCVQIETEQETCVGKVKHAWIGRDGALYIFAKVFTDVDGVQNLLDNGGFNLCFEIHSDTKNVTFTKLVLVRNRLYPIEVVSDKE